MVVRFKKIFLFIIILIINIFISSNVNAIDMKIDDVKLKGKSSSTKVLQTKFSDNEINSDIALNRVGSYFVYEIELQNNESEIYEIKRIKNNLNNKNIKFEYKYDESINKNDKAKLEVKISYDKKIEESIKNKNLELTVHLKEKDDIFKYFVCLIGATIGIIFVISTRKHKNLRLPVAVITLIPILILIYWTIDTEKFKIKVNSLSVIGYSGSSRRSGDGVSSFVVSLDPGNGEALITKIVEYGDKIGELPSPELVGYDFEGWEDTEGNRVTEDTEVTDNIELVAKYKPIEYKIDYDLKGGSVNNPSTYTIETEDFILNNPERDTYIFTGWTGSNGDSEQKEVKVKNGSYGDLSFVAHYTKTVDNLSFNLSGEEFIYTGGELRPKVTIKDGDVTLVEDVDYKITYKDNVNAGKPSVTVTMLDKYNKNTDSKYEGNSTKSFEIKKATPKLVLKNEVTTYTGDTIKLSEKSISLTPNSGGKVTIKYYKDEKLTEEVENVVDAGKYYVQATVAETSNYNGVTSNVIVLTVNRKEISVPEQTEKSKFIFNGKEQTLLIDTETYTVTGDTKGTNAGEYEIVVTPTSNYKWSDGTDSKTITYVISPYNIKNSEIEETDMIIYDGDSHTPTPSVVVPLPSETETTTLTSSDITYSYENNKDAGTATITIKGKGNYTGTVTKEFIISKRTVTYTATNQNKTYDGSALVANSSCELTGGELVRGDTARCINTGSITNYSASGVEKVLSEVIIENDSENVTKNYNIVRLNGQLIIDKKAITCTSNSGSKTYDGSALTVAGGTCTGLVSGQVATLTNTGSITNVSESDGHNNTIGNIVIKDGSNVTTDNYNITKVAGNLEIFKREISVTADNQEKIYDGTSLVADSTCTITSGTLASTQSIECTSTGSITNVGTETKRLTDVKVKSNNDNVTNNYQINMINGILKVDRKTISIPEQTSSNKIIYNGTEQNLLTNTETYTVSGSYKGKNVGEYNVIVTPTGNYVWPDGTITAKTVTYTISPYDISSANVVATPTKVYNGEYQTPTPSVRVPLPSESNPTTLTSSDITYSYENNKDAGTATITITGKGNYTGTTTQQFTIDKANGYVNLSNTSGNVVYGNNSISFNIQSTHGGELEITDDNSTATVTKSGNTVTVSNLSTLSSGTKVKVSIKCAETDNYKQTTVTYTVNITNATLTGGSVIIKGRNVVGETLTTELTDTTPAATYTYKWYRNTTDSTSGGTQISGATNSSYTVTEADAGKYIYVEVTASKTNYNNLTFSDKVDSTENTTATSRIKSSIPTSADYCKSNVVYTGSSQVLTNLSGEGYAFYNNSGSSAGSYTVTARVLNEYIWDDYTISDKTFTCSISKSNTSTSLSNITTTYDGNRKSVTSATSRLSSNNSSVSGSYTYTYYNGTSCSGSALSSAPTNAGSYSVKATLSGTSNYNSSTSGCATLTINKLNATCTSNNGTKTYDGTALTASGGTCTGLASGQTATLTNSGSSTAVYRLIGDANLDGSITEADETLIQQYIANWNVQISEPNADVNKDGDIDINDVLLIDQYASGLTNVFTTPEGEVPNTISSVKIMSGSTDTTSNYNITKVAGTLKLLPRPVTYTAQSLSKTYDGTALSANSTCNLTSGTLVSGHSASCTTTGSITNAGSTTHRLKKLVITSGGTDVTRNYEVKKRSGSLVVNARAITCTSSDGTKTYDGTPLTAPGGTCTNLLSGHTPTITNTGSITNVSQSGTKNNTISSVLIKSGSTDVSSNYNISKVNGTLTITARPVTYTATNQTKEYDGTPLVADSTCTLTSGTLVSGHVAKCTTSGSITNGGSTTKRLTSVVITSGTTDMTDNYSITKVNGTLTVNQAIFKRGQDVNAAMKTLAAGTSKKHSDTDTSIISIKRSTTLPSLSSITYEIVSTVDSIPIYMWYDNGTIYYYSVANTLYLNDVSDYMFYKLTGVNSLDLNVFDTSNVISMRSMFEYCENLTSLDLSHFNTSNVTDMANMFNGCKSLMNLDISHFDTSNVTNMSAMFDYCKSLTSLDLSHFNTSNVTDMSYMFWSCISLISLDVSNFDTSKVTNMSSMFTDCKSLTSLDVSNFNTSKVTNMSQMFAYCSSLTSLDVRNFNTSNATDMSSMFIGCQSLTSLDVSKFNTSKVTNMNYMFSWCSNLTTIYVSSNFVTTNVTSSDCMFDYSTKIKGGNGTTYDSSKTDKEYARIDTASTPGYFTAK